MAFKNYYKLLGLKDFASTSEIKKAYRDLAFRYHPDHNKGGINGAERFIEIKEAYEFLLNPVRKRNLDAHLRSSHLYAPSYNFGKYTQAHNEELADNDTNWQPVAKKKEWMVILKPVLLILITIGLMVIIMKPPYWLKQIKGDKPVKNQPSRP